MVRGFQVVKMRSGAFMAPRKGLNRMVHPRGIKPLLRVCISCHYHFGK